MNKKKHILWIFTLLLLLAGCNLPNTADITEEELNIKLTEAVVTVYAELSQTALAIEQAATPTFTITPEPTYTHTPFPSLTPSETPTDVPLPTNTDVPTATPTSDKPCLRANLETKSIPDGTVIFIDRLFTQTFRIKNTGSCTWNSAFELRFAGGDLMNASASISITDTTIPTWGYANVDVLMKAPSTPGTYRGYWSIKSNDGQIFGVQPKGNSFWVEIKAIDPDA